MIDKLKPCPFCGSKNIYLYSNITNITSRWRVLCKDCDAQVGRYVMKEQAVDAWNRRAVEESNGE